MSGDITQRKNNSFEDFSQIDNFDDSELQARLYAEIYYDSNIEGDSRTTDAPRTIQLDCMTTNNGRNVESDRLQCEPEEQSLAFETTGGHEQEQCPDLWRRYYQTTTKGSAPQDPGNVMKPSRLLYCCNCAKYGHESSTCREYRWSEHFPTPAVVTNYMDGPTYAPCAPSSPGSDSESGFLSSGATENKTSIPQNATNEQDTKIEDMKPSANIDTLSSIIDFYVLPTSQEAVCISKIMEENSFMVNKILLKRNRKCRQTKVSHVSFISIIYSYGYFYNKNYENAGMILQNLSKYFQTSKRKLMLRNLINREVAPVFLQTLLEKEIEFEVKIGYTNCPYTKSRIVQLQLIAMKEYIDDLFDILRYWLNLPDDEKDYGIDVTPPINPIKMFNLLNSRVPQLEKMHFTSYVEHIGTMNDPQWIYNCINNEKIKLKQYKNNIEMYNYFRKKLWQLQIKLLIIVNTAFKSNTLVRTFRDVMMRFESEQYLMGERLGNATYLRLILLYNQLFVPHTSESINVVLRRFKVEERKNKNKKNLQQELEIKVREQGNVMYNVYSSSTSSCAPQNINLKNSSAIKQNNEMLVGQNVSNILLETSKMDCDEITIKYSPTQDSQIIMPLNIKSESVKSEDSEDFGENEDQLSTSEVNIESNLSANKQNINNIPFLTKTQMKKRIKELNKSDIGFRYKTALDLIRKARAFELPHLTNAADVMQNRIDNQIIRLKHMKKLSKLIRLEQNHQQTVNSYCKKFKK